MKVYLKNLIEGEHGVYVDDDSFVGVDVADDGNDILYLMLFAGHFDTLLVYCLQVSDAAFGGICAVIGEWRRLACSLR